MPSEEGSDLEERLADLVALCEGLRALCARGECRGLKLADAEPLAMLAALLASEVRATVLAPALCRRAPDGQAH